MEGLNFERLTQNYLNHCKYEKGLDEKTMKAYNINLAQYASTSSDPNDLFTQKHLQLYIAELHSKYAIKSVKRKIASLKAFFNYLEYEEIFSPNPFSKIRLKLHEPFLLPSTIPLSTINALPVRTNSYPQRIKSHANIELPYGISLFWNFFLPLGCEYRSCVPYIITM